MGKREEKAGWYNRHNTPLPSHKSLIQILVSDSTGEHQETCVWNPSNDDSHQQGYLGTAQCIYRGISWNAWEQNNNEFTFYRFLKPEPVND